MSQITMDALKALDAETALNVAWDDLPELGFKLWPEGTYKCEAANIGSDEINGKPVVKIEFKLEEIIELANADSEQLAAGTTIGFTYFLPIGAANIQNDYGSVGKALGATSVLDFLQKFKGCKVALTVGERKVKDKDTKEVKVYQAIKGCELV